MIQVLFMVDHPSLDVRERYDFPFFDLEVVRKVFERIGFGGCLNVGDKDTIERYDDSSLTELDSALKSKNDDRDLIECLTAIDSLMQAAKVVGGLGVHYVVN